MDQPYNSFEADKKRFRNTILGIVTVVVGLAVAGGLARPYYRLYKERHSLAQAQTFLAGGDYRNALLSARQTLLINPNNVPACRVMAELAELSHSPAVLDWQRRVVQNEPTIENKLALAAAGLRYQSLPFPITSQILDELSGSATNLAKYQMVAANLALGASRLAEAETHFEIAATLEPTNQIYQLNLAIIRLSARDEAKAATARGVLEQFRKHADLALPALRALVVDRLAHQDAAAAKAYSTELLARPQTTLADHLQHLGILQQLHSLELAAGLAAVQRQTNAAGVAEVSAWMQANGLVAENIQWLTNLPSSLQAQSSVRLALANAYLQKEDWQTLRDFASKGNWEEMEFLRLALAARAWSQLGVAQVADSNWGAAVSETGNRYGAMTMLLGLAQRWEWKLEVEDLLERIVQKFPQERWAQHTLEQLYLANGNTPELHQLYVKLISFFPEDAGVKNNLAATSLLLKTNLPQAYKWAAEVYAGRTNDVIVVSTYAYALHLQGRTRDGLAALQKLEARRLEEPDVALYYGFLLVASGATNEAAPFLKIAQTKTQWLPEEKQLLSTALGKL